MTKDNDRLFDNRIDLPRYLTSLELAQILGVSIHTIRSWRKHRLITPKTFGRSIRWILNDVLKELELKGNRYD